MSSRVKRLVASRITRVPDWHPEHDSFEPFPVHVWLVQHPALTVLVDAGVGIGNELIDEWYGPDTAPLAALLAGEGVDVHDIDAIVLTHLHFDHCGQVSSIPAPVYVQARELAAAEAPGYTVPEWAAIERSRLRVIDGDAEITEGIDLLLTPGHTPGHQSVVIEEERGRLVIGGQCAFRGREVRSGQPADSNLHDRTWRADARASLRRIASLDPWRVELSHTGPVSRPR